MRGFPSRRVGALVLAGSSCVLAQDAGPPLQSPDLPPALGTAIPAPAPTPPPSGRPAGGVPAGTSVRRLRPAAPPGLSTRPTLPRLESAGSPPPDPSDPLLPPLELPDVGVGAPPLEGPTPIRLETVPDEEFVPGLEPLPDPGARRPSAREPKPPATVEPASPPPRRRGLARIFAPRDRPAQAPIPESRPRRDDPVAGGDPADEAALKRRIEAQVGQLGGRHLRSLEVRVIDREVIVRARVDRFWNRRPLRREIESLPSLAGYRATVVVD